MYICIIFWQGSIESPKKDIFLSNDKKKIEERLAKFADEYWDYLLDDEDKPKSAKAIIERFFDPDNDRWTYLIQKVKEI